MTHRNSLPVFPLCDLKYIWIQSELKKKKKTTHAWVDNMDQGAFTELVRKMELMKMRESQL